jgi:DNA mismatch endonuclease (patch repair protein)
MDFLSPKARSAHMALIKVRDTSPELSVRRLLHSRGFRFRLHYAGLPGKPDIVLPKYLTIIFVNGCFLHACPHCSKGAKMPSTNRHFWSEKIAKNIERDLRIKRLNETAGWRVLNVWECETKRKGGMEKALRPLLSARE